MQPTLQDTFVPFGKSIKFQAAVLFPTHSILIRGGVRGAGVVEGGWCVFWV